MKISLLQLSVFLVLLFCTPFNANAEIIGGSSIEWLTVSSKIVAVGKIISVEKLKGEGSVVYETYVFEPSEMLKGTKQKKKFTFTIRTFSTEPVFGKIVDTSNEVAVFLSDYGNDGEKFLQDKLVPTNTQFPLSVINLNNPSKYAIDLNFRVLKNKDDILKVSRGAVKAHTEYLKEHSSDSIKSVSLEVPMGSQAFGSLYAGSVCYLIVPNFMSSEAKKMTP